MKFRFISETADGLGIAVRLQDEGNEVQMWIRSSEASEIGDGLINKVGDLYDLFKTAEPKDTIFVFDASGNGFIADAVRQRGFAVIGSSVIADRLEHDRKFGTDLMTKVGIYVPETFSFEDWDEAKNFVRKYKDRLVYKPSKQLGELAPSHVSYDKEDMLEFLVNAQKDVSLMTSEFQLQQFVKGAALSTECWFDGTKFIEGMWNHTLERKELMNDNIGPSGGCVGNIVWACGDCPVCDTARSVEEFLVGEKYIGPIDLNAVVNEDGVYGLEWTPRFGYDATPTLLWELIDGDVGQLLSDVARGQIGKKTPKLKVDQYAGAVRITIPPWPTEKHHAPKDIPIRGLQDSDWNHTYFYNVKMDNKKSEEVVSAGAWGILLLFTGIGSDTAGSLANPEKLADKVRIPDKQYRTDLVKSFNKDLSKLVAIIGE